jgi:hypothetical protein
MKKTRMWLLLWGILIVLNGCRMEPLNREKKNDLDFTVVSEIELTEPVKRIVEERKKAPFKVTFSDEEFTYILIGYGKQEYTGYRIRVKELYESDNGIFVTTEFSGPKEYQQRKRESYPYLVVKIEYTDKNIIFSE